MPRPPRSPESCASATACQPTRTVAALTVAVTDRGAAGAVLSTVVAPASAVPEDSLPALS
ncbi:hypothetical protein [Streptomyces sp. NPDC102462]|uniref:hypothetical protein n=1 Tax=Streptomyces sp. NPDC102462 TaxID=3366178 RepID=UPI00380A43BC